MKHKPQPDAWDRISPSHLDDLISQIDVHQHVACIFEAIRDFNVRMLILPPTGAPIDTEVLRDAKPFIAVIDDDRDTATGPEGFHQESLRELLCLTDYAAVMSTAPNLNIYRLMSLMPSYLRSGSLIIETRPSHDQAWARFLRNIKPDMPIIMSARQKQEVRT